MKLLSVREAAERLGVSPALVYGLCARKRIRHERHGLGRGVIKIPEDALEEYQRSVTVDAEPAAPPTPVAERATAARFEVLDEDRLQEAWKARGP
jgi:excisionase family DNA binding protein